MLHHQAMAQKALPLARPAAPRWRRPPRLYTTDGRLRRVGVEIEFAGLDVDEACAIVRRLYGGTIEPISRFGAAVRGTRHGDFRVEIDSMPLKNERYKRFLDKVGAGAYWTGIVEDVLESIAGVFIPAEIVTSPIAIDALQDLERLRWALHERNAEGTRASILYTFGFQLNPEVPGHDPATITRYMRAFLILQDWLFARVAPDATREWAGWTEPFPEDYRRRVLHPSYDPDEDALIGDYLEANPTRNRAVDMLPLFAMLQEERVLAAVSEREREQIKPRPTFHYRLPNCLVDDPGWSFAREWNRWVEVERLAEDPDRMSAAARELLAGTEVGMDGPAAMEHARRWGVEAT